MTTIRITVFMTTLLVVVSGGFAQTMLEQAPTDQQALYYEAKPHLIEQAQRTPRVLQDEGESYFWVMGHIIEPLAKAYRYSHDPEYLRLFVPLMENILSQRYISPTEPDKYTGWWYGPGTSNSYMVIHAAVAYYNPALIFIKEVRDDPALQQEFGAYADAWFEDITQKSIPMWDLNETWHELGGGAGWYSQLDYWLDPATGAVTPRTDTLAGVSYAINKVHAMIESFAMLYEMTGDPWYRDRMEKCAQFFYDHWEVHSDHVQWDYRIRSGEWDYYSDGSPRFSEWVHYKSGYYAADVHAIMALFKQGIFYSQSDIDKLVQTNLEYMWRGDYNNPTFRKIDGRYDLNADPHALYGTLWTALASESELTRQLWRTRIENNRYPYGWEGNVINYLIAEHEARQSQPAGQYLFYNNSNYDGNDVASNAADDEAIAIDKEALKKGRTATFVNYTSYDKGINGVMVDLYNATAGISAGDFEFRAGNDSLPDGWGFEPAPTAVTYREGAGSNGSHRVTITFADFAIRNQWMRVTVKANANTGLSKDYDFYFGNTPGETGDQIDNAIVDATDEINARINPRNFLVPAGIDCVWDHNRDMKVDATDQIISRNNPTTVFTALRLLTVP